MSEIDILNISIRQVKNKKKYKERVGRKREKNYI